MSWEHSIDEIKCILVFCLLLLLYLLFERKKRGRWRTADTLQSALFLSFSVNLTFRMNGTKSNNNIMTCIKSYYHSFGIATVVEFCCTATEKNPNFWQILLMTIYYLVFHFSEFESNVTDTLRLSIVECKTTANLCLSDSWLTDLSVNGEMWIDEFFSNDFRMVAIGIETISINVQLWHIWCHQSLLQLKSRYTQNNGNGSVSVKKRKGLMKDIPINAFAWIDLSATYSSSSSRKTIPNQIKSNKRPEIVVRST